MTADVDAEVSAGVGVHAGVISQQPVQYANGAFNRMCRRLAQVCVAVSVTCLIGVVLCVQWQVVGRYLLNDTPTWAEAWAMLLVLFLTAFGIAVGVRDSGHIGLESFVSLLPPRWQRRVELVIHALVGLFGAVMAIDAFEWASLTWDSVKPMIGLPDGIDYVPLVIAGVLITLFSIEHIAALLQGRSVEPTIH